MEIHLTLSSRKQIAMLLIKIVLHLWMYGQMYNDIWIPNPLPIFSPYACISSNSVCTLYMFWQILILKTFMKKLAKFQRQ